MEKESMDKKKTDAIQRAQSGDSEAISYLLEKYKSMVRALARPLFLIDGEQDDLVQEGMIGLFKAIQTYDADKGASFETFANTCISGQLYTAIKKSNRQKNIPLNSYVSIYSTESPGGRGEKEGTFVLDKTALDWQNNPEEIVIGRENARSIQEKLYSRLSKMEVQVLDLFLTGMTYQEIAMKLDKSPKSIDNALQRIKGKLHKMRWK